MTTEVTAAELSPIILVQAEFDSGDTNLWSGYGNIVFDGDNYTGAGNLLQISSIEETEDIEARGVTITVSGIPSSLISIALSENYQDRPIKIWFGALNESTGALISDPELMFRGRMDTMQITEDGETALIAVRAENNLIALKRPRERRYTSDDQKLDYSTDTFFDQVPALQDDEIVWGRG